MAISLAVLLPPEPVLFAFAPSSDGDGVRTLTPESLTGRDLDQGVRRLQGGGWEAGLEGTPQGE